MLSIYEDVRNSHANYKMHYMNRTCNILVLHDISISSRRPVFLDEIETCTDGLDSREAHLVPLPRCRWTTCDSVKEAEDLSNPVLSIPKAAIASETVRLILNQHQNVRLSLSEHLPLGYQADRSTSEPSWGDESWAYQRPSIGEAEDTAELEDFDHGEWLEDAASRVQPQAQRKHDHPLPQLALGAVRPHKGRHHTPDAPMPGSGRRRSSDHPPSEGHDASRNENGPMRHGRRRTADRPLSEGRDSSVNDRRRSSDRAPSEGRDSSAGMGEGGYTGSEGPTFSGRRSTADYRDSTVNELGVRPLENASNDRHDSARVDNGRSERDRRRSSDRAPSEHRDSSVGEARRSHHHRRRSSDRAPGEHRDASMGEEGRSEHRRRVSSDREQRDSSVVVDDRDVGHDWRRSWDCAPSERADTSDDTDTPRARRSVKGPAPKHNSLEAPHSARHRGRVRSTDTDEYTLPPHMAVPRGRVSGWADDAEEYPPQPPSSASGSQAGRRVTQPAYPSQDRTRVSPTPSSHYYAFSGQATGEGGQEQSRQRRSVASKRGVPKVMPSEEDDSPAPSARQSFDQDTPRSPGRSSRGGRRSLQIVPAADDELPASYLR